MVQSRLTLVTVTILLSVFTLKAEIIPPKDRMDYHMSWDGKTSALKIDLLYHPDENDSTLFIFGNPLAGGQPEIFKILSKIRGSAGDSISINSNERKIVVHHLSKGLKKLSFEIDGSLVVGSSRTLPNEAFRTTIIPGFFYTLGYQFFMDRPDSSCKNIGIVWDNWPLKMPYFVSTNPEAKPNELQIIRNNDTERNSFMLQMSDELVIEKHLIKGIPNYLLTSKKDTSSELPKSIIPFMTDFIPKVRDFWNDYDAPFYILSAMPLRNNVKSTMTGMALLNGFTIRYRGALDDEKTQLISHEISHTWIGVRLRYKSVGMENNWFDEGFNDYIAVYNLVRSGIFKKEAFLKYMNDKNLRPHYTSPVGSLPADSIAANFFKNAQYEKITYQRGLIYAFYLDNQIRVATKGEKSIKEFLLSLYQENKKENNKLITDEDFIRAVSRVMPRNKVDQDIKTFMLEGKLINFKKAKLVKAFKIEYINGIPELFLSNGADLTKIYY
jgi:hypothetical protein